MSVFASRIASLHKVARIEAIGYREIIWWRFMKNKYIHQRCSKFGAHFGGEACFINQTLSLVGKQDCLVVSQLECSSGLIGSINDLLYDELPAFHAGFSLNYDVHRGACRLIDINFVSTRLERVILSRRPHKTTIREVCIESDRSHWAQIYTNA
ncbi:hypothetical protein BDR03DRAFT_981767 [Suillus americanus]|nr:hypothetical protein BDR03DRAFT_981767 [Suillus americanus]